MGDSKARAVYEKAKAKAYDAYEKAKADARTVCLMADYVAKAKAKAKA